MSDTDWRMRAHCRDEDPELFHPGGEGRGYQRQIAAAKRVCGGCPVRAECLREALRRPSVTLGIWGGTTKTERDEIVRRTRVGQRASQADEVAVERGLRSKEGTAGMGERDKTELMRVLHAEGMPVHAIASRARTGASAVRRVLGVTR